MKRKGIMPANTNDSHSSIHSSNCSYNDADEENATPNITNNLSGSSNSNLLLEIGYVNSVELSAQSETSMNNNKSLLTDELDKIKAKRCEYARNQMKKYRLKIKSDPARYLVYLENERARNRKRREQKILELTNSGKTLEQAKQMLKNRNISGERKVMNRCSKENNNKHVKDKGLSNILGRIDSNTPQNKQTTLDSSPKTKSTDKNQEADEWLSYIENPNDNSNDIEEDIKYNRICGVVTCPSRLNTNLVVHYYPIPTEKSIRDIWFKSIKSKTKQSEIDPDSFICSLHFAPEWFELDEIYNEERLLPVAVPTLFPESQIYSQYETKIPIIFEEDLNNSKLLKNYYEWSVVKIRQFESQLKEQLLIIENLNESKEIQNKRMDRLIKASKDYKLNKIPENKKRCLQLIFDKIQDIEEYSTHR